MPTRTKTAKTNQNESAKPSSEIDLSEIIKMAEDVEKSVKMEPEVKVRKRKANGRAEVSELPAPPPELPPDPEFQAMVHWGVTSVTDVARERFDWSDPGVHWRDKVSLVIARLIARIRPMQPGPLSDLITLAGYSALWVIPNVTAKRTTTDTDTLRNNGERQNLETP